MAKFKKGDWVRARVNWIDTVAGDVMQVVTVRDNGVWMKDRLGDDAFMNNSEVEPWTPKVGELVRFVKNYSGTARGREAAVLMTPPDTWGYKVEQVANGERSTELVSSLEPLPVAAEAQPEAPLRIQAGKFYRTRDGRKIGPMEPRSTTAYDTNELIVAADVDGQSKLWRAAGGKHLFDIADIDLIAEWPADTTTNVAATVDALDEEYGPVVKAKTKFKVGDRIVQDKEKDCQDLVTHWNDYWKKSNGPIANGCFVVCNVSGNSVMYSNRAGGNGPLVGEEYIKQYATTSIVCKLSDGQPLPASLPRVHTSADEANEEAKWLASVNKGQEFGVFTLGATHKVEKTYEHEWQRLAAGGNKISAINELRSVSGLSLRVANDAVEDWLANAA